MAANMLSISFTVGLVVLIQLIAFNAALELAQIEDLTKSGYLTDLEKETLLRVKQGLESDPAFQEKNKLAHELCEVFGAGGNLLEVPSSTPLKQEIDDEWKKVENASLDEQMNVWKKYSSRVGADDPILEVVIGKNGCVTYLNAYKAAADESKPDPSIIFSPPNAG